MAKKAAKAKSPVKPTKDSRGLFVPAGIFLGMGFGFAFNNLVAGLFIGLGAGFLVFALLKRK